MPTDPSPPQSPESTPTKNRTDDARALSPAAQRALAEAAARRGEHTREDAMQPKEVGGRAGSDPTRYGDWEVNGLTSDF